MCREAICCLDFLTNTDAQNENPRTRMVTVQMIARAAADPHGGAVAAMDAMQYFSSVAKERTRYQTLVDQLDDPACTPEYSIAVLQLMTNIVNRAQVNLVHVLSICFEHVTRF
jgi:hypothetical protein